MVLKFMQKYIYTDISEEFKVCEVFDLEIRSLV